MRRFQYGLIALLCGYLGSFPLGMAAALPAWDALLQGSANKGQGLPNANSPISLQLEGVALNQALQALAQQGKFNIVLESGLNQPVTLNYTRVPLVQALLSLKQLGQLQFQWKSEQKALLVRKGDATSAGGGLFLPPVWIQLEHLPAQDAAAYLRQVFGVSSSSSTAPATGAASSASGDIAAASAASAVGAGEAAASTPFQLVVDADRNALLISSTADRLDTLVQILKHMDVPRKQQIWQLGHLDAVEAAKQLNTLFASTGSGSGAGGASAEGGASSESGGSESGGLDGESGSSGGESPSAMAGAGSGMSVRSSQVQEGSGATTQTSANNKSFTGRSYTQSEGTYQPNYQGILIIPDDRTNTLSVMGTPQQLQQVAQWLQQQDVAKTQVFLEVQILELAEGYYNVLAPSVQAQVGKNDKVDLSFSGNGASVSFSKVGDLLGNPLPKTGDLIASLNALRQQRKISVLSNPSILGAHNEESLINVMEEVVQGFQTVTNSSGGTVANIPNIVNTGIMLSILPKVGANGDVSLRVNPVISWPQPSVAGSSVTLVSRRELISQQVIVPEGHSFVLGGLTQSLDTKGVTSIPGFSKLPILGALARSSTGNRSRSELLIIVTPHLQTVSAGG